MLSWLCTWNAVRKLGPTHICGTGLYLCLKERKKQNIHFIFCLFSIRFHLWWPSSCWLGSATTTSSMPQSTNVLFPWTSSVPYPGGCTCPNVHDHQTLHWQSAWCVCIFQDSEFWYYQVPLWLPVNLLMKVRQNADTQTTLLRILCRIINTNVTAPLWSMMNFFCEVWIMLNICIK